MLLTAERVAYMAVVWRRRRRPIQFPIVTRDELLLRVVVRPSPRVGFLGPFHENRLGKASPR